MQLRIPCSLTMLPLCAALAACAHPSQVGVGASADSNVAQEASAPTAAPKGDSAVAPPVAENVVQCNKYVQGEWSRQYSAARKAQKKWNDTLDKVANDSTRSLAKQCLAKFPLSKAKPADLRTISTLYGAADFRDSADLAARMNVQRAKSDSAKAEALEFAVGVVGPGFKDSGDVELKRVGEAAEFTKQLDAMGPKYAKQQFGAHNTMSDNFRKPEDIEKRLEHINALMAIAPKLTPEQRKQQGYYIGRIYTRLADHHIKKGEVAKAKEIIAQGLRETADLGEDSQRDLKSAGLVESPLPPLVASNWFNAPEGTKEMDPKGKISLVMITAHW
jgi:hypothetical protein